MTDAGATKPVLLVGFSAGEFTKEQIESIHEAARCFEVLVTGDENAIRSVLPRVEIAAGGVPRRLLGEMPKLQWFQQWSAGADWLLSHPEVAARDFVVTGVSGIHGNAIAEHVFAMILSFVRFLPRAMEEQKQHSWCHVDTAEIRTLSGKTMVVFGVGSTGRQIARVAGSFDMTVIGVRRHGRSAVRGFTYVTDRHHFREYLPAADVVVLSLPLTNESRGLVGRDELALLKPSALLINVGRGGILDEEALAEALKAGRLAGAGLDVFATEPLPPDSPLWEVPNLIITGHYAGSSPDYHGRALSIFFTNLKRYLRGETLENVVDKKRGY